ncbi:MAG: hypothetical protein KBB26_04780 [Candidatus Omnitrophica bacterium]|nr:hypothetical protein [Candidatus Omnitrophota bacterium]
MQKYAILKIGRILLFAAFFAIIVTTTRSHAQYRQRATVGDGIVFEDKIKVATAQVSEQPVNKKEVPGPDLIYEAWKALEDNDIKRVETVTDQIFKRYGEEARRMQASLKEYPWGSMEKIRHYQPLNDVGTAYFILGEIYRKNNNLAAAKLAYQVVIDHYFYSQTTDNCLMWKPVEAAKDKMYHLSENENLW